MVHGEEDDGSDRGAEVGENNSNAEGSNGDDVNVDDGDGESAVGIEEDGEIKAYRVESIWGDESEGIVNIDAMNERFYGEDADFLEEGYELS